MTRHDRYNRKGVHKNGNRRSSEPQDIPPLQQNVTDFQAEFSQNKEKTNSVVDNSNTSNTSVFTNYASTTDIDTSATVSTTSTQTKVPVLQDPHAISSTSTTRDNNNPPPPDAKKRSTSLSHIRDYNSTLAEVSTSDVDFILDLKNNPGDPLYSQQQGKSTSLWLHFVWITILLFILILVVMAAIFTTSDKDKKHNLNKIEND